MMLCQKEQLYSYLVVHYELMRVKKQIEVREWWKYGILLSLLFYALPYAFYALLSALFCDLFFFSQIFNLL